MNKSKMAVLFVAMDKILKRGHIDDLQEVIETGIRETVTNPIPVKSSAPVENKN